MLSVIERSLDSQSGRLNGQRLMDFDPCGLREGFTDIGRDLRNHIVPITGLVPTGVGVFAWGIIFEVPACGLIPAWRLGPATSDVQERLIAAWLFGPLASCWFLLPALILWTQSANRDLICDRNHLPIECLLSTMAAGTVGGVLASIVLWWRSDAISNCEDPHSPVDQAGHNSVSPR